MYNFTVFVDGKGFLMKNHTADNEFYVMNPNLAVRLKKKDAKEIADNLVEKYFEEGTSVFVMKHCSEAYSCNHRD